MKKPYDPVEIDIVRFGAEDVLATSGGCVSDIPDCDPDDEEGDGCECYIGYKG